MSAKQAIRTSRSKPPRGDDQAATRKAGGPLYLQVASQIKKDIVGGIYPVGSLLPTEDALCERFAVSRYTVREALRRLRDDNLVASRQGAGTIVVPGSASDAYAHDVMSINDLVSWSVGRRFVIESMEMVKIDDKLAARTGLTSGEEWLAARGFGHVDGETVPVCWAEYYIHRDFAAIGRILQRHSGPVFPLIEDLFGQRMAEVHQEIGATLIPAAVAESLGVKPGTAALEVRRSFKLTNGQTAQVTISTHPAARYRHSMTMRRVRA